jgi:hypothetical protein
LPDLRRVRADSAAETRPRRALRAVKMRHVAKAVRVNLEW